MTAPLTIVLKRGKSKPLWVGHPWVFSGAIARVDGEVGDVGGPCLVEDDRKNVLGAGYYNPHGAIAVRLHEHRRTTDHTFTPRPLLEVVRERLPQAIARRTALGLPAADTDAFRLVNSEGDELPGLVVDRLGDTAVVHLGSRAMYEIRDAIAALCQELLGDLRLVVRVGQEASRLEAIPAGCEQGEAGEARLRERGVTFVADPVGGQKTGHYCDQRDNRARFGALCGGERVLDLYAYTGGFGLQAARSGARSVVAVDSSGPALERLRANATENAFETSIEAYREDAIAFLKEARARRRSWSRIVCDPPKFARGRGHLTDALKKYARLNTLAMGALAPGGLLLTCSCSQHIGRDVFLRMLTEAAHRLRTSAHVHALWGQPEDHPYLAVAPEGAYLKAALVSIGA